MGGVTFNALCALKGHTYLNMYDHLVDAKC